MRTFTSKNCHMSSFFLHKSIRPLAILIVAVGFFSLTACDKEHSSRVKYEVRCPGGCTVTYLSGTLSTEHGVSGNWSKTFNIDKGEPFFLSAAKTSVLGNASVVVYIDGQSFAAHQNNAPYGAAVVEGQVPLD